MNHGNWSVEIGEGKGNKEIYGYQDDVKGRQQSDYTYIRVQTFPKLDPITIDEIDNSQSILRGKGYPRSKNMDIYTRRVMERDNSG